jgi:uncharacterized protein
MLLARLLFVICLVLGATACSAQNPDELTARVMDDAKILSTSAQAELAAKLEALERRTTDQLIVVTVPDLKGEPIESFGLRRGNEWGIGRDDIDNGVLLIVAPSERQVRIEVGFGLEGLLTDDRAAEIIDAQLLPHFRRGEMEEGVKSGVEQIIRTLQSNSVRPIRKQVRKAA